MINDPQMTALQREDDLSTLQPVGLQPNQRALSAQFFQPQQAQEAAMSEVPNVQTPEQPMAPALQPAQPQRAIADNRIFQDRAKMEALKAQHQAMTKPISWEHDLDVQKIRNESPKAFQDYKDLMAEHGVIDQNGITTPAKMQEFMTRVSVDPELFEKLASPKISVANMKFEEANKKYRSLQEKTHPADIQGMAKLKEAEALNEQARQARADLLYDYAQGRRQVEDTGKKMQKKQAIGQFLLDNEPHIRNLPPQEQKLLQTLFMTGDIDGFADFMGDHPDLTTAYNARGQR